MINVLARPARFMATKATNRIVSTDSSEFILDFLGSRALCEGSLRMLVLSDRTYLRFTCQRRDGPFFFGYKGTNELEFTGFQLCRLPRRINRHFCRFSQNLQSSVVLTNPSLAVGTGLALKGVAECILCWLVPRMRRLECIAEKDTCLRRKY